MNPAAGGETNWESIVTVRGVRAQGERAACHADFISRSVRHCGFQHLDVGPGRRQTADAVDGREAVLDALHHDLRGRRWWAMMV